MIYRSFGKRLLDLTLAVASLLFLLPLFLALSAAIKLDSRGPIFFRQSRLGYQGGELRVFKFRSMTDEQRTVDWEILNDHDGVTRTGRIMRRFKLDEIPQLLNIVRGDMSLVGPRPCMEALQEQFDDNGRARLKVRPGLTGLAQINGNIHLSWPERWRFDRIYVESYSFRLDLYILAKTVLVVVFGEEKFKP